MKKFFKLIVMSVVIGGISFAQVPVNLQGALFKKIFNYNKTLQTSGIKLAVVYGDEAVKDEIIEAFKQFGLFPSPLSFKDVEKEINNYTVLYITPGCGSVKSITDKNKVFSISGIPALAEKGEVSIAIGIESGRPKIIINKKKIESEGQNLSPELLKIAKVL